MYIFFYKIYFFSILYVIFFVVIVFPIEPFQNNFAYAQENMQKCFEFIDPSELNELKKLRRCVEEIKISKNNEKANQIILNSYEGSYNLSEKILNWLKTPKIKP